LEEAARDFMQLLLALQRPGGSRYQRTLINKIGIYRRSGSGSGADRTAALAFLSALERATA
jgi:hypothetical protein